MKIKERTQNETKKEISKNAKCLILSDLIYTITDLFSTTFLVAYFLKITKEREKTC